MHTRSRVVVGSIVGAVVIHLAMLACSGPSVVGRGVASTDGGTTMHTDGGGFLDVVRDAITALVDGETPDAVAQDAGGSCSCPTYSSSFALMYDTGSGPQTPLASYSTGGGSASPTLVGSTPAVKVSGYVTFFDALGNHYTATCTVTVQPNGQAFPGAMNTCYFSVAPVGATTATEWSGAVSTATVSTLTDTSVELDVPTVTLMPVPYVGTAVDSGVASVTLTSVAFRGTSSAGGYVTPPNHYQP